MKSRGGIETAQSVFQVGGKAGSSLGPLLAAFIVVSQGKASVAWFSLLALLGAVVLWKIGTWQKANLHRLRPRPSARQAATSPLSRRRVGLAMTVLVALVFFKYGFRVCAWLPLIGLRTAFLPDVEPTRKLPVIPRKSGNQESRNPKNPVFDFSWFHGFLIKKAFPGENTPPVLTDRRRRFVPSPDRGEMVVEAAA